LTAFESIFGWTVIGEVDDYTYRTHSMAVTDSSINKLWELESLGIRDSTEVMSEKEKDTKVKQLFMTVKINDDVRYVVKLPWKEGHPVLPTNRNVAIKRLENTSNKLKKAGLLHNFNDYSWNRRLKDSLKDAFTELSGPEKGYLENGVTI
jgi:hypothetical protein